MNEILTERKQGLVLKDLSFLSSKTMKDHLGCRTNATPLSNQGTVEDACLGDLLPSIELCSTGLPILAMFRGQLEAGNEDKWQS